MKVLKRRAISLILIILCLLLLIGTGIYAAKFQSSEFSLGRLFRQSRQEERGTLAATYKNHQVTKAEVAMMKEMRAVASGGAAKNITDREIAEDLILGYILLEEAERMGLTATEEEIEQMVDAAKLSYSIPDGKEILDEYCAGAGITIDEYYEILREQAPRTIARQKVKDAVGKAYCEENGIEFSKVNPPPEIAEAVEKYLKGLLKDRKGDIVYYLG